MNPVTSFAFCAILSPGKAKAFRVQCKDFGDADNIDWPTCAEEPLVESTTAAPTNQAPDNGVKTCQCVGKYVYIYLQLLFYHTI